jgi:hypothetical protein
MRKLVLLFCSIVFVLPRYSKAQSSELGALIGVASYKGEINNHLFNPQAFNPSAGLYYKRCLNSFWSFRLGLTYGRIAASDANAKEAFNQYRNLSFRNDIWDASALFEFNFFPFQTASEASSKVTPFLVSGLTFFHHNPQAFYNGSWHDLQPLGTEGQGSGLPNTSGRYKRVQFAFPIGGGVKFKLSYRFSLSVEAIARRTYTDYLDDVSTVYPDYNQLSNTNGPLSAALSDRTIFTGSEINAKRQRGNASDKDWYMMGGVTINWTLSKKYTDKCKPFRTKLR